EIAEAAAEVDARVGPARAEADQRPRGERELDPRARVVARAEARAVVAEAVARLVVVGPLQERSGRAVHARLVAEEDAREGTAVELEDQEVDLDRDRRASAADDEGRGVGAPAEGEQTLDPEVDAVAAELPLPAAADDRELVQVAVVAVDLARAVDVHRDVAEVGDAEEALHQGLTGTPDHRVPRRDREGFLRQ